MRRSMIRTVSFIAFGEGFRPSDVDLDFTEKHDAGSISERGRYRGKPNPSGSILYEVPQSISYDLQIQHLVEKIEPLMQAIKDAGATDYYVSIGRFYSGQCNEEYSFEEIILISKLKCTLTYSAYECTEIEIEEMFRDEERS